MLAHNNLLARDRVSGAQLLRALTLLLEVDAVGYQSNIACWLLQTQLCPSTKPCLLLCLLTGLAAVVHT